VASKDFHNGHYTTPATIGLRAFGRAYSAWPYGQAWFREHGYLFDGKYASLDDFLRAEWDDGFLAWDANDVLVLLRTWQLGDVSKISSVSDTGDFAHVLTSIKAKGLIMPCKTDLYFPPEDSEYEVSLMPNTARLVVIPSVWGHMAGGGSNDVDLAFLKIEIERFLNE